MWYHVREMVHLLYTRRDDVRFANPEKLVHVSTRALFFGGSSFCCCVVVAAPATAPSSECSGGRCFASKRSSFRCYVGSAKDSVPCILMARVEGMPTVSCGRIAHDATCCCFAVYV